MQNKSLDEGRTEPPKKGYSHEKGMQLRPNADDLFQTFLLYIVGRPTKIAIEERYVYMMVMVGIRVNDRKGCASKPTYIEKKY